MYAVSELLIIRATAQSMGTVSQFSRLHLALAAHTCQQGCPS